MLRRFAIPLALMLAATGCLSAVNEPVDQAAAVGAGVTDVRTRTALAFDTAGEVSRTLENGIYEMLPVESVFVDVTLPLSEGGSAADGSAKVHMGLWLPDVPAGTKVPVIADVGPYYSDGDVSALEPAQRLGEFLINNFVPHGYAVAQVSVFGSGESTHCMDLMGAAEQAGVDAAVTWLGSQEWSNGNVGLIGRSYDGSTPWEAAMFGNPALKTIVPISGLTGAHELMWRNGSAEFRGPIMHNVVYGAFGIDSTPSSPDAGDAYTACPDYLSGPVQGLGAYVTGDHFAPAVNDYWSERYFLDRALANYKGSVYFIHGMQDWNVDPHMAFPAYQKLVDAGLETKGLFGQWAHMYPDRAAEHERLGEGRGKEAYPKSVRMDWAQDLLEWFDHYLKGTGAKPALHVEIQDNMGGWRIEPTYPPQDAMWTEIAFADMTASGDDVILGAPFLGVGPGSSLTLDIAPLSETDDVRIAGLGQVHPTVVPFGPGGQLYAILTDAKTGMHLAHAIMDLRFHQGGNMMVPVVPGAPIVAMMEFEPFDVVVPKGHGLKLTFATTGEDYLPPVVNAPVQIDTTANSVLRLPIIERSAEAFFEPVTFTGKTKADDRPRS